MNFSRSADLTRLTADGEALEASSDAVADAFRDLCFRDMIVMKHEVLNLIAGEIEFLREHKPDLSEFERGVLARKLVRQRILCYVGALDQLF